MFARTHARVTAVARSVILTLVLSAQSCPAGLFRVAVGFYNLPLEAEHSIAHCDLFPDYFADNIDCIPPELDASLQTWSLDVPEHPFCPVLWDCVTIMQPKDVVVCACNPYLSWLIKTVKVGLVDWLLPIINSSLSSEVVP